MSKDDSREEAKFSKAFEEFEKSRATDPISKMLFSLLDGMDDGEFKSQQVENAKKIMVGIDLMENRLKEIFSSEEGRQEFIKELEKRSGEE